MSLRLTGYLVTTILAALAVWAMVGSVMGFFSSRGITWQNAVLKYWSVRGYSIPEGQHDLVLWNGGDVWYISDNGCVPVWAAFDVTAGTDDAKIILPPIMWSADEATDLLAAHRDGCLNNPKSLMIMSRWKDTTWAIVANPLVENADPAVGTDYRQVWTNLAWVGVTAASLHTNASDISGKVDQPWKIKSDTAYGSGMKSGTSISETATLQPIPRPTEPQQFDNGAGSVGIGAPQDATPVPSATPPAEALPQPTYPVLPNGNLQVRPEIPQAPATPIPTAEPTWVASTMVPVPTQASYRADEFPTAAPGNTCLFVGCLAGHPAAPAATADAAEDKHSKLCHALFWQYADSSTSTIPPGDLAMIEQCTREGLYQ